MGAASTRTADGAPSLVAGVSVKSTCVGVADGVGVLLTVGVGESVAVGVKVAVGGRVGVGVGVRVGGCVALGIKGAVGCTPISVTRKVCGGAAGAQAARSRAMQMAAKVVRDMRPFKIYKRVAGL
jgi:hypothetical protein